MEKQTEKNMEHGMATTMLFRVSAYTGIYVSSCCFASLALRTSNGEPHEIETTTTATTPIAAATTATTPSTTFLAWLLQL